MDNVGILEGHYDVNIETKKKMTRASAAAPLWMR